MKKKFSRWKFPNERYSDNASKLLRTAVSEPTGFHQGAVMKGHSALTDAQRQKFTKLKAEARAQLGG